MRPGGNGASPVEPAAFAQVGIEPKRFAAGLGNQKRKRRGCPRRLYVFATTEIDQPRVLSGYCGGGGAIGAGCIMTGVEVTNPESTGNFQRMPSMMSFELKFENL
jgi:hypothetical protein